MIAAMPILDPEVWVRAFVAIPASYKAVAVGLLALWILLRWWPGRKKNGN